MSGLDDVARLFAPDYATARGEFNRWRSIRCCDGTSCLVPQTGPQGEKLSIDFARIGYEKARSVVVVSSGLHGVEGFFGAAVQLALLQDEDLVRGLPQDVALLLIHALDPWGFAWVRRVNEDNVDLNRNFLLPGQPYAGCPELYAALDGLLNPRHPPSRYDIFRLRALLATLRHGMPPLKQAVAGGQYEFPRGLFYGGQAPARTVGILTEVLPRWLGAAERIVHFDFHTGLGRWATYQLLVDVGLDAQLFEWSRARFGAKVVHSDPVDSIAYQARGDLAAWCRATFPDRTYDLLCAEFGTYPPLRVLAALRAENQAHYWGGPDDPMTRRAKLQLLETFVPASPSWRALAVTQAREIVRRAIVACAESSVPQA
jgi:hypothetical protein